MNMKHTPGPWRISENDPQTVLGGDSITARIISINKAHAEADARLIAAAPDLLGALQFIITDPMGSVTPGGLRRAQKAIDKALGVDPVFCAPAAGEVEFL